MSDKQILYGIRVENDVDIYGQDRKRDRLIGIFDAPDKAEEMIRQIYANPYFSGSLSVVTFPLNEDMSGYSNYSGVKIEREKR